MGLIDCLEFKPCPFCGGTAHISSHSAGGGYYLTAVVCDFCGANTGEILTRGGIFGDMFAYARWQTRKGNERECDE